MSSPRRGQPLLMLVLIFGLLPAAFILFVFLPVRSRMAADRARLEAAVQRNLELPNVQPLTSQERALLQDPNALWRGRVAHVQGDAQRLAHYHRVVTELQRELTRRNVKLLGVRSTWTPIKGSFTLPTGMGERPSTPLVEQPSAGPLEAWVLEVQIDGSPADLFKALEALPVIRPVLEPVALRWQTDATGRKQVILLRNIVSLP